MKNQFKLMLVALTTAGLANAADPILAGKSVMGCAADVISVGEPSAPASLATPFEVPATCADFSGEWVGGCFENSAYPTNWPTKDGYVVLTPLTPTSAVTAAPIDSLDLLKDQPDTKVTLRIAQEGCQKLSLEWNGKKREIQFDSRTRVTQSESFWRECDSDGHKWRRTYEFLHDRVKTPLWRSGGQSFRLNDTLDGNDANYRARYLQTVNHDYVMWQGHLRLNATIYVKASRFDPPAFEFSPPSVGADICIFKKAK